MHEWGPVDLSPAGCLAFTQTMGYLAECVGLTRHRFPLDVRLVFGQEKARLEDLLLRGKAMERSGLNALTQILGSLPRLQLVEIVPYHRRFLSKMPQQEDLFLRWAFTDTRQLWLWLVAREELQSVVLKQPNGIVVPITEESLRGMNLGNWAGGERLDGYETWLLEQCKPGASDYEKWLVEQT